MTIPKLTREQAAIIGAFTGLLAGPFSDIHKYAQEQLERSIWSHEFASPSFRNALKDAAEADFLLICATLDRGK